MSTEIIIGLGGILLATLTYFAGVYRTKKNLDKEDRDNRIGKVLDTYLGMLRSGKTGGLDGLQKSGVANLLNDGEISEVIDRIIGHAEKNPLGTRENDLKGY